MLFKSVSFNYLSPLIIRVTYSIKTSSPFTCLSLSCGWIVVSYSEVFFRICYELVFVELFAIIIASGFSYCWFKGGFTVYGLFIFLMIMSFAEHLSFACIWASDWTDSFGPMNEFDIEAFVFYEVSRVSLYCPVYAYDSSFSKDYFNPPNDKGKISLEYRHLCKNLL